MMYSPPSPVFFTLLSACLLSTPAAAQSPTRAPSFFGQVVNRETGEPVRQVLLRLDTGDETLSDEDGRFRLESVEAGKHLYALLTSDCAITWGEVQLVEGESHEATLTVTVAASSDADMDQETSRRTRSKGKLVTADEIDAMHAVSMAEVIRRVAPTMVMGTPDEAGAVTQLTSRGSNSIVSRSVPIVVIDGIRIDDGARALDNLRPSEVRTLEILAGAGGGWEYGSSGSGGVIKVTTGRRDPSGPPSATKKCVVPDFPG